MSDKLQFVISGKEKVAGSERQTEACRTFFWSALTCQRFVTALV
jgi:hypothetical protein